MDTPPKSLTSKKSETSPLKIFRAPLDRRAIVISLGLMALAFLVFFTHLYVNLQLSKQKEYQSSMHFVKEGDKTFYPTISPTAILPRLKKLGLKDLEAVDKIQYLKDDDYGVDIITVDLATKEKTIVPKIGWGASSSEVSLSGRYIATAYSDNSEASCTREILDIRSGKLYSDTVGYCKGPWPFIKWVEGEKYTVLINGGPRIIDLQNMQSIAEVDGYPRFFNESADYFYYFLNYDGIAMGEYLPATAFLKIENNNAIKVKEFPTSKTESNMFLCWDTNTKGYLKKETYERYDVWGANLLKEEIFVYDVSTDTSEFLCNDKECVREKEETCSMKNNQVDTSRKPSGNFYEDAPLIFQLGGIFPDKGTFGSLNNDNSLLLFQARVASVNDSALTKIFVGSLDMANPTVYEIGEGVQPRWISKDQ